jgi:NADPH-dependent 2,4-dienoyl-CoA reductase/sulfur reductase-like enzyme/rhodanese-related sulfurtransferase
MARKVLIVGGVAGGASAAARLRRLDETAEIIMFERGDYVSFANCGLPYYIGGTIRNHDALLLQTPESFKRRFNVDVRVHSEVVKIDPRKKEVQVVELTTGKTYPETYDQLILSPGAEPVVPPIPGVDSDRVFTLRNVADMDRIIQFISTQNPHKAAVVGAGYIGLEMAENFRARGLSVELIEMLDQVMPTLDKEMAWFLQRHLSEHSVTVRLGDGVRSFDQAGSSLKIRLSSGSELDCDFAMLTVGVRPEVKLAREAGLEIGDRSGIKVNEHLQTSDPDIYAIGDAVEVRDFVLGGATLIPLAGPANKQGRMAADNLCGRKRTYNGSQGTGVLKVFDLTVAMTGANEKALAQTSIDYEKLYLHPANHAGYYPGARQMHMKLLFAKPDGKILGVQIVGSDGVDKRIDVLAVAIRAGMTVFDLQELELAYAPPYGSGKDPINIAGYAAANILDGMVKVKHFNELEEDDFVLDVRTPGEVAGGALPNARNISVDQLRDKLNELPRDRTIHAYCAVGLRSYIACRILQQNGFDVRNLSGGYMTYQAMAKATCGEAVPALGNAGILPAAKNKGKMPSSHI